MTNRFGESAVKKQNEGAHMSEIYDIFLRAHTVVINGRPQKKEA